MYDTMGKEYFWPHVACDVYKIVRDCNECVWNKPSENRWNPLHTYPAGGTLEFSAMQILELLPNTLTGNQLVLVMPHRYSSFARAVTTYKTTVSHMASMFMDHCTTLYRTSDYVLTGNGTQFISLFVASSNGFAPFGTKNLTMVESPTKSNQQAESSTKQ